MANIKITEMTEMNQATLDSKADVIEIVDTTADDNLKILPDTLVGGSIENATAKEAIIDADVVGGANSANSFSLIKTTWTGVKAFLKTYFDTLYQAAGNYFNKSSDTSDDITEGSTQLFLTVDEQGKLGYISVTQAVDLDQMETDIAALANGMVYKGNWDASAGTFPGSGSAQIGWFYYVTVAGTVDGVEFAIGDNIVATADNASTGTYSGNWSKHDQTDAVQSVAGKTGAVVLNLDDISNSASFVRMTTSERAKLTFLNIGATLTINATTNISTFMATVLDDADALAARTTLGALSTTPTLSGDMYLQGNKITVQFTAGENLVAGDWCYLKSDGKMWKADASAEATAAGLIRMCNATILTDAAGKFAVMGTRTTTGLTAGATYYLSETAGAMTATRPTTSGAIVRIVGVAESTTKLRISISEDYIELT